MAAPACNDKRNDFDAVYCLIQDFQKADRTLNLDFARLNAKLGALRRQALRADEVAWLGRRDGECGRHDDNRFYVDLACAAQMTDMHRRFLDERYRACVRARCSDLDFYNAQDGASADSGPQLTNYPAISRYHGRDAGYIAVYTHDQANTLYSIGSDMYVAGFIRLRGHYEGRIFQPMGYAGADISANRDFKKLTDSLFPGHRGSTWAGGDTGGFVAP